MKSECETITDRCCPSEQRGLSLFIDLDSMHVELLVTSRTEHYRKDRVKQKNKTSTFSQFFSEVDMDTKNGEGWLRVRMKD